MSIRYTLSRDRLNGDFLQVLIEFVVSKGSSTLCLPFWRPGRYERADYHKRIKDIKAWSEKGKASISRQSDNRWQVNADQGDVVKLSYNFYARRLDAGGTWIDDDLFYVNPVNCCMYIEDRASEPCNLFLDIPDGWRVATGLKASNGAFVASNFDELADSPVLAAKELTHLHWQEESVNMNLWFHGFFNLDKERLRRDFSAFFKVQLDLFGSFPVEDYHFLFIFPEKAGFHGVEHVNSTVIYLGPAVEIKDKLYNAFLGVSSHELFHTWNVKNFRPGSMTPYDFSKENYSDLGYVYEGFTTYYGDLILARAGVFDKDDYFKALNVYVNRHAQNYGRFNLSVADSSYSTWVDGYEDFTPWRKTSIYVEGAMNALYLDILLRKEGSNLDEVLRSLYELQQRDARGYERGDLLEICSGLLGRDAEVHWLEHYEKATDFIPILREALRWFGCSLEEEPSPDYLKRKMGIDLGNDMIIKSLAPGSPAAVVGLTVGDEILGVGEYRVDARTIAEHLQSGSTSVLYSTSSGKLLSAELNPIDGLNFFSNWKLVQLATASAEQKRQFEEWCGLPFEDLNGRK